MEGIPPDQQLLIFAEKELEDGLLLSDYAIKNTSTLYLLLRMSKSHEPIEIENPEIMSKGNYISILTLTGKHYGFNFKPQDTVLDIKQKIHQREGIPPDQQRLVYEGIELEDGLGLTLSAYSIMNKSILHLV